MITILLVHQSRNVKQGFLLQTYHLPKMKMHLGRLSSKVIGSKIWSQDISEEMQFILLCSFSKKYPNDLLSSQTFCWFSFDKLSIICTIVLSTFLAFIYFTSQLHICYLTSCSFHPILYIGMFMLCLFALTDFVYIMHFGAFIICFIK